MKKVFCIGLNKTGTTSLEKALKELGFKVGKQSIAEELSIEVFEGIYDNIFKYIDKYNAFQDLPFSVGDFYKVLYKQYPEAKFILSLRDDENEWYKSQINFQTKRLSKDGLPPRVKDLKESKYRYKGWEYEVSKYIWLKDKDYSDNDFCFDEIKSKQYYLNRNEEIISFFQDKKDSLLVINLKEKYSYKKMCEFLGKKPIRDEFPHENKGSV